MFRRLSRWPKQSFSRLYKLLKSLEAAKVEQKCLFQHLPDHWKSEFYFGVILGPHWTGKEVGNRKGYIFYWLEHIYWWTMRNFSRLYSNLNFLLAAKVVPNFVLNHPQTQKKVIFFFFKFTFWKNGKLKVDKNYMKKLYYLALQHIKIRENSVEPFSRKKIKTCFEKYLFF